MNDSETHLHCEFKVNNSLGLHARPASMFVEAASCFESEVLVEKEGETVNGKSLMGLLMLSAGFGSCVKVIIKGNDASDAMKRIATLFENNFDEE